jgi:hypothetical protein
MTKIVTKTRPVFAKSVLILTSLLWFVFQTPVSAQNVGVGTSSPNQRLDVNGWIKLGNNTSTSSGNSDAVGSIRYNTTDGTVDVNTDGTSTGWQPLALNKDLVKTGTICMWQGITVPGGWQICDGTNSTPDLRNRFVTGAGVQADIGVTGGNNSLSLGTNELPAHTHTGTTAAAAPTVSFTGTAGSVAPTATFAGTATSITFNTPTFAGTPVNISSGTSGASFAGTSSTVSFTTKTFTGNAGTVSHTGSVFAGTSATLTPATTFTGTNASIPTSASFTGTAATLSTTATFTGTALATHTHSVSAFNYYTAYGTNTWKSGSTFFTSCYNGGLMTGAITYANTSTAKSAGTPAGTVTIGGISYTPQGIVTMTKSYTPTGTIADASKSYTPAGTVTITDNYTPAGTINITGSGASYQPAGTISVPSASHTPAGSILVSGSYTPAGNVSITGQFTPAGTISGTSHTHTSTTGTTGSGTAIDIRPSYYALAFIMKM